MSGYTPEYPRALYHYTTQHGLIGIIRDRVAWATNICYMNDAREFSYARELLREAVASLECNEKEQFSHVLPFLRPPTWNVYPNVFVFSMSEHDDRLGLWRAYAGGAAGYSIGFSTAELRVAAEKAGFRLVKCTYDKAEQQRLVVELLEDTRSWANSLSEAEFWMVERSITQRFWETFTVLAAQIKDPSFSEEAEWRLVSDGMHVPKPIDGKEPTESKAFVFEPRQLRVRVGLSTLTPYVELPLANQDGLLPIYHICVGPSIDPPRAAHAVGMLLNSYNQNSQKAVHGSIIPYRTW